MSDPEVDRIMKRQKLKFMWQVSALYTKPIPFLLERVKEIHLCINHMKLEASMMQRFIEDNQLDIPIESSKSSTESCSETSQSASVDAPITSTALSLMNTTGKRIKKGEINLEQKFNIAQNYMKWLSEEIVMKRWITSAYITDLIASIKNQDLIAKKIQQEIKYLLSKVGPAVCFAKIKPGEVPGRNRRITSEKFWKIVFVNNNKRDRNIRGTKLDNITLLQQIRKLRMIQKYEEQVDATKFYRWLLENSLFPNEISKLANKRMRLLCRTSVAEREAYNLRRYLEKRVAHGDKLRGSIEREKYMMGRVEQSLAKAVATRDKAQIINDKQLALLSDYRVPEVVEYVDLTRKNEELKEIVKMWEKKVAVAKLVEDTNQQKWRRLTKLVPLSVRKEKTIQEHYA